MVEKLIMSSTNGFLEQPTLSNAQFADGNRHFVSVFPHKCQALLDRLFKLNVSGDQSKACSNLLYLLSFDAALRTVFPEKIMDNFEKMLQRIDNGEMDPCRDFLSICEKVNPCLGNFVRVFDYGDAFDKDALVFLRYIDEQIPAMGMGMMYDLQKCMIKIHLRLVIPIISQLQAIKFASRDYFLSIKLLTV